MPPRISSSPRHALRVRSIDANGAQAPFNPPNQNTHNIHRTYSLTSFRLLHFISRVSKRFSSFKSRAGKINKIRHWFQKIASSLEAFFYLLDNNTAIKKLRAIKTRHHSTNTLSKQTQTTLTKDSTGQGTEKEICDIRKIPITEEQCLKYHLTKWFIQYRQRPQFIQNIKHTIAQTTYQITWSKH